MIISPPVLALLALLGPIIGFVVGFASGWITVRCNVNYAQAVIEYMKKKVGERWSGGTSTEAEQLLSEVGALVYRLDLPVPSTKLVVVAEDPLRFEVEYKLEGFVMVQSLPHAKHS